MATGAGGYAAGQVGFLRPLPAAESAARIRALDGWLDDGAGTASRRLFAVALAWPRTPDPVDAPIAGAVLVGRPAPQG